MNRFLIIGLSAYNYYLVIRILKDANINSMIFVLSDKSAKNLKLFENPAIIHVDKPIIKNLFIHLLYFNTFSVGDRQRCLATP